MVKLKSRCKHKLSLLLVEVCSLKRQEDMLTRQQDELSRMRQQLIHGETVQKSTGQLASTSAKLPVTSNFDVNTMQAAAISQQARRNSAKPTPPFIPDSKPTGRRRGSTASTIDLEAMDALNEARLKRLAALENDPQLGTSSNASESTGVLLDFLKRKNNGSRPASGKSLFSDSVLKPTNE